MQSTELIATAAQRRKLKAEGSNPDSPERKMLRGQGAEDAKDDAEGLMDTTEVSIEDFKDMKSMMKRIWE
jgi:hypothetical protein